ncbi:hypothetical protein C0Q70_10429 [Pomacea canaliculata]|uniref:PAT complex subunit CCDC47 n=1 Tax=Pomacea canaliculata TaxID=400727 RepID=A0A2T7PCM1_POMCA|nr:hypothetical protein C0Q70_10429 [Pomacea canaliculata]
MLLSAPLAMRDRETAIYLTRDIVGRQERNGVRNDEDEEWGHILQGKMRWLLLLWLMLGALSVLVKCGSPRSFVEDNDFAEFEEFDEEEEKEEKAVDTEATQAPKEAEVEQGDAGFEDEDEEDGIVEADDEFEHLQDEEEFENFDKEKGSTVKSSEKLPDLQMAKVIRINMDEGKMDKFVFAVAQKKTAARLHKDIYDLNQFTEKKSAEKFDIPASFQLLSESGEATSAMLDKKVCQVLTKYENVVEYIHVSDQYSGPKSQDDTQPTKPPQVKPVLIFCFSVGSKGMCKPSDMEGFKPLLQLVFYCIDKVSRFQLSKEARSKAEKKRQKVQELFLKAAHGQRQEAAQQRREEKIRADRERLMNEDAI